MNDELGLWIDVELGVCVDGVWADGVCKCRAWCVVDVELGLCVSDVISLATNNYVDYILPPERDGSRIAHTSKFPNTL